MSLQDITTYCDDCEELRTFMLVDVWSTILGVAECYECEYCGYTIILEEGESKI